MRYAYAITAALLLGGAATTVAQQTAGGGVAQNAPSQMASVAPRPGAPMSFADLAAKLQPAVVNISTEQKVQVSRQQNPFAGSPFEDLFRQFGGGPGGATDDNGRPVTRSATSLGSGFIVSSDGYIVTNNHVISGVPTDQGRVTVSSITVTVSGKEYKARVIGKDPTSDLAVLKIDATNLPFVQFGDSTKTRVGDWVIAIGNPFALGGTVTAGIVSAIHRSISPNGGAYDRYIQTDAAINQGNSGGPMFDLNGNVVGINTAIFSPTGGNVGIGFAIPAEQAKPVVMQLMRGERVHRGYLGVTIESLRDDVAAGLNLPKDRGAIVTSVQPGQPAARAGIMQGDVILRVANQDVTPDNNLSYIVSRQPVGGRVPIELIRGGKRMTVTAVLSERPPEDQLAAAEGDDDDTPNAPGAPSAPQSIRNAVGLSLQTLTPQLAQQMGLASTVRGVVITAVDPSSDAATKGLQPRDVILAIAQRPVTNTADAATAIDTARKAGFKTVLLLVQRGNRPPTYLGIDFMGK